MRPTYILVGAILVAAVAALLTTRVTTQELTTSRVALRPVSIDIMGMMQNARELPAQQFDAI